MVRESYIEKCLCRMRAWIALRGLAPNSVSTYVRCARQFLAHVERPLAAVKQTDIAGYLHTLVAKARSARTRNVQLGAIRCLLLSTVRRDPSAAREAGIHKRVSPHTLRHYLPLLTMSRPGMPVSFGRYTREPSAARGWF